MSSKGMRAFQLHQGSNDGAVFGSVRLGLSALDADDRRQLYRQPLIDLQDLASGRKQFMCLSCDYYQKSDDTQGLCCCAAGSQQSSLISAQGGTSSAVEQAVAVPRPLPFVTKACVCFQNHRGLAPAWHLIPQHCFGGHQAQITGVSAVHVDSSSTVPSPVQATWHPQLHAQPHRACRPGSLVCGDHLRTALGPDTSGGTDRQAVVQLAGMPPDIVCKTSYADQLWR